MAAGCCLGAGSQRLGWDSALLQVTDVSASLAPGGAPEKEARLHACLECGCSFTSAGLLLQHSKAAHGRERIHVCPVCRKAFKRATHLKVRPRRQSTEVPVFALRGGAGCVRSLLGEGSGPLWTRTEERARRAGYWDTWWGHSAGAVCLARGASSVLGYWSTGPHRRPGARRAQASFLRACRGVARAAHQLPFSRPAAGYTSHLHSCRVS